MNSSILCTFAFEVDVSNYEEVKQLRKNVENDIGPVDLLVNNAGILARVSLLEGKAEDVQRVLNVNLLAHFWVSVWAKCT